MIVLDTNVISELMRPEPSQRVVRWVGSQPLASLFTTSISEAEILLGVALLAAGKRRKVLQSTVAEMFAEDFAGRVLPFDSSAADIFATIVSSRQRVGRPISHADAQIAAIARCHGASVATRNVVDFDGCDVELIDPFASA